MGEKSSGFTAGTAHFRGQDKSGRISKHAKTLLRARRRKRHLFQRNISAKSCFIICSVWICFRISRTEDKGFRQEKFTPILRMNLNLRILSEIVRFRSRWNNSLRELWNLMLLHQVKWNKSLYAAAYFTLRSNISHAKRISQIPQGFISLKKDGCFRKSTTMLLPQYCFFF